jgi:glycosyltransferase involved in cell wall biosynthesis
MKTMNILYISNLIGTKWSGPNKSVPNQVKAQSKYDNVLWFNINDTPKSCWSVDINLINSEDVPSLDIDDLPAPFNHPDLVVFQGLYFLPYCKIARKLKKRNIPYIIIPRSSLTAAGQRSKALKKKIGNMLFFNKFIKDASAIQYLTKDEYTSSGDHWNKTSFIIPNGEEKKTKTKVWNRKNTINGVFIGRLDIYQKGLDLLIQACAVLKDDMKAAGVEIDIYGPDRKGSKKMIMDWIVENQLNGIIRVHDPIFDEQKEAVLLDSDFFILTSRFEGHPMGLIEALSYGLPCLVTSGSNMADEIRDADAGWTSEVHVKGIVQSFRNLLNEKDRFSEKGNNALHLSQKYDWDELAKFSKETYEKLTKRSVNYH